MIREIVVKDQSQTYESILVLKLIFYEFIRKYLAVYKWQTIYKGSHVFQTLGHQDLQSMLE